MFSVQSIIPLLLVTLAAFLLNLPFGYMRVKTTKFSLQWFLYIHLPIPFIYFLRKLSGLSYIVIPVIVIGAVLGQYVGGKFNKGYKVIEDDWK